LDEGLFTSWAASGGRSSGRHLSSEKCLSFESTQFYTFPNR
jgi:hypothetical protein